MVALGVDVSLTRGLDLVVLDEEGRCLLAERNETIQGIEPIVARFDPGAIAIDSPPGWGLTGPSRILERRLAGLGIHAFPTPAEELRKPLHGWMEAGFSVFGEASRLGYPLFAGNGDLGHCALEVFPHASAVVLRGSLPARGARKIEFRRDVLQRCGVDTRTLTTIDLVDAALAALTAIRALQGSACWVGLEGDAVLVLPVATLPGLPFTREDRWANREPRRQHRRRRSEIRTGPSDQHPSVTPL